MEALAASGETFATVKGVDYIAADMKLNPSGTFLTGVIGFSEQESVRKFEGDAFSWMKGEVTEIEGATNQTVVPFAVDLRPHRRWVAYVVSQRIRSAVFRDALAASLNRAVGQLGLLPSEWEVDSVLSVASVEEWLSSHPEIVQFSRRVKLTNALKDVDEARRKMRLLGAAQAEEIWKAPRGQTMRLDDNAEFDALIAPIETGDAEVVLVAKVGKTRPRFQSKDHSDRVWVPDFTGDLERGVELVLEALRQFSEQRGDVLHGDGEGETAMIAGTPSSGTGSPEAADTVAVVDPSENGINEGGSTNGD